MKTFQQLADSELNKIFGVVEGEGLGDQDLANEVLKKFYRQSVVFKYFLLTTGKWGEYESWLKRFRKSYPNIESIIEKNLELDVIIEKNLELDVVEN